VHTTKLNHSDDNFVEVNTRNYGATCRVYLNQPAEYLWIFAWLTEFFGRYSD